MPLTITLSIGITLTAENPTDTSYMPIASVLIGDRGGLPDFNDPKLAAQIMRNLGDPDFIKRMAYGIVALFPEIPEHLAWFDHPTKKPAFGIAGLPLEDLTKIVTEVGKQLKPTKPAPQNNGFSSNKPRKRR